ncbi:MAG: prolyl oligopeptidase family serine peptidase [Tannerella sp.]|nr:prolyl oligopeptidase family serine peptidase [Tannerella sp.]
MRILIIIFVLSMSFAAAAQKAMTVEDLASWQRITEKAISDDGKWVLAKFEPWRGDSYINVYNAKGEEIVSCGPVKRGELSATHWFVATKTIPLETSDSLKLKKKKPKEMPMDCLIIFDLQSNKEELIDSLSSYKLSESADRIAYQALKGGDTLLFVRSLDGSQVITFKNVKEYLFASKSDVLYFVSQDTADLKPGLYAFSQGKDASPQLIHGGKGVFKAITADENATTLAFLYCADKKKTDKEFELYLSENNGEAQKIATRKDAFLPEGWIISENGRLRITKNSRRLFFGIAPEPKQKDTTQLAENRPLVHIWRWNEDVQYTVQEYNRNQDLRKTYTVAYNIENKSFVKLTSPEITQFQTVEDDGVRVALITTSKPYELESMWEGQSREDVSVIDLLTGEIKPLKTGIAGRISLSPKGTYATWYNSSDSSWYSYSIADGKEYRLTTPQTFAAWADDHDTPSLPRAYGSAGWTANDESLLLYDKFDLWRFSPTGASEPVNLTKNGRELNTVYRYLRLDRDEQYIDLNKPVLLSGFNQKTKGNGYYSATLSSAASPKTLLNGDFSLSPPVKAKKSNSLIYTKESFDVYPDIHLSDLTFKRSVQLTHGVRQQDAFLWGTAELTSWISLDGNRLEGVIYKPANFDPSKKYPLIVNFYEKNADTYNSYRMPEPHRSSVDYHFYNSNGYIVFNPDIVYTDGYPGESCYKAVMSGTTALIAKGYINEKAIGAQGHSWGGYQDAYLAAHTNLFAAIESGAPVVNMLSAYGGIRWGSGMNRSFQYEHGQSRIGKSIWESPLRYIENSPLFDMDKVTTPILIMANDQDGHVPWYQGIEFFVALKRLQKPAWLLNYSGEPHWPTKMPNKIDFQKRMFQFFEHFLNGKPMPKWMSEGIPAIDRDFELGY